MSNATLSIGGFSRYLGDVNGPKDGPITAKNLYEILKVPETASKTEIEEAFEREKRFVDPSNQTLGKIDWASTATLFLYDAYGILSDDTQRERYDASRLSSINEAIHIGDTWHPAANDLQDDNENYEVVERLHKSIPQPNKYVSIYSGLLFAYQKLHNSEEQWWVRRYNRIYGGSTLHLLNAAGDNYQRYCENVRTRVQLLARSDSLALSSLVTQVADFRTALSACDHHPFSHDNATKTWLQLLWSETERTLAWITAQRHATEWYMEQVELHLHIHLMRCRALHVWPVYLATGNSTPMAGFVPNYLPHLSEAQVSQLIRETPVLRSGWDMGMSICGCEDMCFCRHPTDPDQTTNHMPPAPETIPKPKIGKVLKKMLISPFREIGKSFKKLKPTSDG